MLGGLRLPQDDRLLVGIETGDDAGVFLLRPDLALVQTVDFFTPIVDDPYTFGQVAGANALSDVYAMGGTPVTALNIAALPARFDPEAARAILQGGADKVREAGAVVVGGHTVEDPELKYGLAVTGTIDPKRILTNRGARPGDRLVLTKRIGTGVVATAAKKDRASEAEVAAIVASMTATNAGASRAALDAGVVAATDVTGFGLLGHAFAMATASRATLTLHWPAVPLFPGARAHAEAGLLTGCGKANARFYEERAEVDPALGAADRALLADPQTSGGLLLAVPADRTAGLIERLEAQGVQGWVVGEVGAAGGAPVRVRGA